MPESLPADLLQRRPDLREAEQRLIAATARQQEALAHYEKAVQSAFADVRVALAQQRLSMRLFGASGWRAAPEAILRPVLDAVFHV